MWARSLHDQQHDQGYHALPIDETYLIDSTACVAHPQAIHDLKRPYAAGWANVVLGHGSGSPGRIAASV